MSQIFQKKRQGWGRSRIATSTSGPYYWHEVPRGFFLSFLFLFFYGPANGQRVIFFQPAQSPIQAGATATEVGCSRVASRFNGLDGLQLQHRGPQQNRKNNIFRSWQESSNQRSIGPQNVAFPPLGYRCVCCILKQLRFKYHATK